MEPVLPTEYPFATVIVPTFRDWKRLRTCLDALAAQSYPSDRFEIIVANNDPNDPQPAGFALAANCRILDVAKPGSYAARNAALRLAKGSIIGFTDSDCIPVKNWIADAVGHFKNNPDCSRIAGRIIIYYEGARPTAAELYNTLYSFPQEKHVRETGTSVTGNLFVRRDVFDAVGVFDEEQLSLGDLFWGRRATKAGYKVEYVPSVAVQHPARNFRQLVIKERRVGGGKAVRQRGGKKAFRSFVELVNGCRPRLAEIKFIFRYGGELSFYQKMKVVCIRHYLLNVRTLEEMRVALGKQPNRA